MKSEGLCRPSRVLRVAGALITAVGEAGSAAGPGDGACSVVSLTEAGRQEMALCPESLQIMRMSIDGIHHPGQSFLLQNPPGVVISA